MYLCVINLPATLLKFYTLGFQSTVFGTEQKSIRVLPLQKPFLTSRYVQHLLPMPCISQMTHAFPL